jgi:DNA-directed RNA polymerase subunit RPC12/RpoP
MKMRELECTSCGAAIEWDGTYGEMVRCPYCGSTFMPAASVLEETWLMTDPVARARYEFDGTLNQLEHDLRFEVMRGEDWTASDREYLREVARLEKEGTIRKLASFWAVSPHPSVYRALSDGELRVGGKRLKFSTNDEIVWACPMTRDRFNLGAPLLIGDFQGARIQRMCGKMVNAMQGRIGRG